MQLKLSFAIECTSVDDFLVHWSVKYDDPNLLDSKYYEPFVGRFPLVESARRHLFEWKNGGKLSHAKLCSIEQNYPLSRPEGSLEKRYLNPREAGGPIWNIFYMHCVDPGARPIFDQHTYRAMRFMKTGRIEEIPASPAEIYRSYRTDYIPFVNELGTDRRKIDRALHTFGQFLKKVRAYC